MKIDKSFYLEKMSLITIICRIGIVYINVNWFSWYNKVGCIVFINNWWIIMKTREEFNFLTNINKNMDLEIANVIDLIKTLITLIIHNRNNDLFISLIGMCRSRLYSNRCNPCHFTICNIIIAPFISRPCLLLVFYQHTGVSEQ